jgi:acetylornithine deacetylase/succinyl-diaminopimelate desuccinylase-like protein
MKDMDAMILAIVRLWARIGYKPPRDIVLAFFADEEAGSIYGSRWIAKKRPELFAGCTEAISEVGGFSYTLDTGKRIYAVQSAEKGINWMKLTATGNAGHGSMINEKNAVTALTEAVTKIGRHKWPIRPTKTVKILFKKVAELTNVEYDENNLGKLLPKFGSMGSMIGATLQNIANPTMLEAGYKANVIPQSASAIIDGRFLPGYESELAETIKELVGPDIKVEVLTRDIALEVDFSGPLVDAMCAALKIEDPEGIPVPYLMSGGTDNKALSDLGIVGFGFSPIRFPADLEFMPLFHGINERVPVDGLKFGVRTLHHFLINC